MKLSKPVQTVLDFAEDNGLEIVSFGLAPNPDGFCFELYGDACRDKAELFSEMLDALTSAQTNELRKYLFG